MQDVIVSCNGHLQIVSGAVRNVAFLFSTSDGPSEVADFPMKHSETGKDVVNRHGLDSDAVGQVVDYYSHLLRLTRGVSFVR